MNRSSDIESEGNISIKAKNLVNKKEIFEISFKESHEDISYKIPHLNAPNYYDAVRKFDRQILTAQIDKETADANIIASGNINIDLDKDLTNHYSKIKAGKNYYCLYRSFTKNSFVKSIILVYTIARILDEYNKIC